MITQIYNITLIPDKRDDLWWKSNDGNIPKNEFIPWLAIKGNPTTQDKIRKWGTYDMLACPLCINDIDSHNNLFFSCDYADRFWHLVKRQIDVKSNGSNWEAIVNEFATMKNGNTIRSVKRRRCLAASIYLLWQERNNILFKDVKRRVDELFKRVFGCKWYAIVDWIVMFSGNEMISDLQCEFLVSWSPLGFDCPTCVP
ncbi:reverse transcriptase zinc-binding domain-containing protein [Tanacetum coccineum]